MFIQNKHISLTYKIIAIIFCVTGITMSCGFVSGKFNSQVLLFYTIQSNILCLIYFILSALFVGKSIKHDSSKGSATFVPQFKGSVVMAITVTMLIFWVLLSGSNFDMGPDISQDIFTTADVPNQGLSSFENYIVHLIVPLITIFDWILFDAKGQYRKSNPFTWLIIPLIYYIFSIIVAQTGYTFMGDSHYPYFFIDSDSLGWGKVAINVFLISIVFLVIGYLVYFLDKFLGKKQQEKSA